MSNRFENLEIYFKTCGNKKILTAFQCADDPRLAEFIKLYSHCFEPMPEIDAMAFYPDGVPAPTPSAKER